MDAALALCTRYDTGEHVSQREEEDLLAGSKVVNQLINDLPSKHLPIIFRLAGMAEIPYIQELLETQSFIDQWKIDYIYQYPGYIPFEGRRNPSAWLSYLLPFWLSQKE